jgi:hypothetical protein
VGIPAHLPGCPEFGRDPFLLLVARLLQLTASALQLRQIALGGGDRDAIIAHTLLQFAQLHFGLTQFLLQSVAATPGAAYFAVDAFDVLLQLLQSGAGLFFV